MAWRNLVRHVHLGQTETGFMSQLYKQEKSLGSAYKQFMQPKAIIQLHEQPHKALIQDRHSIMKLNATLAGGSKCHTKGQGQKLCLV